jgi:hypothetical protein
MGWLTWLSRLGLAAVLLHPAVVAIIATIVANAILGGYGQVSMSGVNVFKLRITGVELKIKAKGSAPAVTMRAELVMLAVQVAAVVSSWFEERPFRLLIAKPELTIDHQASAADPLASVGPEATGAAEAAAPSMEEGIVATVVRDPILLQRVISAARLVCIEVTDAAATDNRISGSIALEIKAFAARLLYQAPPVSPNHLKSTDANAAAEVPGGALRASVEMSGFSVRHTTPGEKTATPSDEPSVSMERTEFSVEADLGARCINDVSVSFSMRAAGGVRALSAAAATLATAPGRLPAKTASEVASASDDGPAAKAKASTRMFMVNSPRRVNVVVTSMMLECIDDRSTENLAQSSIGILGLG